MKTLKKLMVLMVAVLGWAAGTAPLARACGFCGGDKAASVYSFKNKQFAEREDAHYISVEIAGGETEEEFARAVSVLESIDGVYSGRSRGAFAQRAVSFVYKKQMDFELIAREFSKRLPGWELKLVEQIQ